jgi:PBP1b-binding outer membrane lipoprotein LpoB
LPLAPAKSGPYHRTMKAFLSLLLSGAALVLTGCESDVAPAPRESQAGRVPGQLVQPDRSDDPVIQENTRVGY